MAKTNLVPLNTHKNRFGSKEDIFTIPPRERTLCRTVNPLSRRQPSVAPLSSPPSLFSTTNNGGKVASPREYSKEKKERKME